MRPPRFRLRTLMVAVAVAGAVIGGVILRGRGAELEARALHHG